MAAWSTLFVAIVVVALLLAVLFFLRLLRAPKRSSPARLEPELIDRELSALIDQLATEFPEEVHSWGGPGVLWEPAIVDAIVERLNREHLPPSTGAEPSAALALSSAEGSPPALPKPDTGVFAQARRSVLVSDVRRVADAHAKITRLERMAFWWIVGLGLLVSVPAGPLLSELIYVMYYSSQPNLHWDWGQVSFAGFLGALTWGGFVVSADLLRRERLKLARQNLAYRVREFAADFPAEVQAWGGTAVLRNPESVRELLRGIGSEPLPDALPPATGERLRQMRLTELLRRLGQKFATFDQLQRPALWRQVAVGAAVGLLVGVISFFTVIRPHFVPTVSEEEWRGLSQEEQKERSSNLARHELDAVWVGLYVVILVGVVSMFLQVVVRISHENEARRGVKKFMSELETEFPDEVRSWGGPGVLRDPATRRELFRSLGSDAPPPSR
jgi:hypothetical protein